MHTLQNAHVWLNLALKLISYRTVLSTAQILRHYMEQFQPNSLLLLHSTVFETVKGISE